MALKPADATSGDLIFKGLVPRSKRFNAHLKAAEIPKHDAQGHVADFHSLRHTFCTYLQRAGVSQREVMELMRHNDPRLTASTYTDTKLLGLRAAVGKLSVGDSQRASQKLGAGGLSVTSPVTTLGTSNHHESSVNTGEKSLRDTTGHNMAKVGDPPSPSSIAEALEDWRLRRTRWCALQGLNLQERVCFSQ